MLDHVGLVVADPKASRAFYSAALKPLGIGVVMDVAAEQSGGYVGAGYGYLPGALAASDPRNAFAGKPSFWIGSPGPLGNRVHLAFMARSRGEVNAFYEAAIAAGGKDNGGPGERPHYHPGYYGAFVLDPDGHNVEAVCHTAP